MMISYHIKIPSPKFKNRSREYVGFERKFLHYTQRHEFARALLEEHEIRLGDVNVTCVDIITRGR